MNIISLDGSRATWLFPLEEFLPLDGIKGDSVVGAVATRYNFSTVPQITTREKFASEGLRFGNGEFSASGKQISLNDFVLYTDGMAATAATTETAESFLEDVNNWVKEKFEFRDPLSQIGRLYGSSVVVEFEYPISNLLRGYESLAQLISAKTRTILPEAKPMEFSRLDFEIDKTTIQGQAAHPKFIMERRVGSAFSRERFYSTAPMTTADHMEVLRAIEDVAAANSR